MASAAPNRNACSGCGGSARRKFRGQEIVFHDKRGNASNLGVGHALAELFEAFQCVMRATAWSFKRTLMLSFVAWEGENADDF